MLIVILLYDQLLFRPLVAWVDRFRVEQEPERPRAAVLGADRDAALATDRPRCSNAFYAAVRWISWRCRSVAAGAARSAPQRRGWIGSGLALIAALVGRRALAAAARILVGTSSAESLRS